MPEGICESRTMVHANAGHHTPSCPQGAAWLPLRLGDLGWVLLRTGAAALIATPTQPWEEERDPCPTTFSHTWNGQNIANRWPFVFGTWRRECGSSMARKRRALAKDIENVSRETGG